MNLFIDRTHQYEQMMSENSPPLIGNLEETLQKLEDNKKIVDANIWRSLNPYVPVMKNTIESIAWNYNNTKIAVACFGEKIIILDHEFKELAKIDEYKEGKISWHKKKNILAFLGSNKSLKFYQFESRKISQQILLENCAEKNNSFFIDWHPTEDLVAFHE